MNLTSFVNDYLNFLEFQKQYSKHTIKDYRYYLTKFVDFHQQTRPRQIDSKLIKDYSLYLKKLTDTNNQPLRPSTRNYFLIALRSFLDFLAQEKGLNLVSSAAITLDFQKKPSLQSIDEQSINKLLMAVDLDKTNGPRDLAIILLLHSTGLKVSELTSLNRDQIDTRLGNLSYLDKNGHQKRLKLSKDTLSVLEKYLNQKPVSVKPLFIRLKGASDFSDDGEKMRLSARSVERLMEKYVKSAGLSIKATPKDLRHSFAFKMISEGDDLVVLQNKLGLLSKNSAKIYQNTKRAPNLKL